MIKKQRLARNFTRSFLTSRLISGLEGLENAVPPFSRFAPLVLRLKGLFFLTKVEEQHADTSILLGAAHQTLLRMEEV